MGRDDGKEVTGLVYSAIVPEIKASYYFHHSYPMHQGFVPVPEREGLIHFNPALRRPSIIAAR